VFFSQKTGTSEERSKDVKLASREPNDFFAFNCFMARGNAKLYQVLQAGMIKIRQNYYVKKWETIFTVCIKITRRDLK
jgi:hypothetical protein